MARFSAWFVWKKGFKTLTKNKSKTIPILILLVFSIAFGTLTFTMQDFRSRMIVEVKEAINVPEATTYFDPIPESVANKQLENITGDLKDYELRMMILVEFKVLGEKYDGLVLGIDTSRKTHLNALIDTNKEEIDDYEFAINWAFAERVGLEIGEKISISYGSVEKDVKVKNIGYNPEFSFAPLYRDIAFPSLRPYPILYVDNEYLNDEFLNQTDSLVSQLLYQVKDKSDAKSVENEIEDTLKAFSAETIAIEDQAFYKTMREDEESDRQMLMFLTIMLLVGAIITLILVMNKLVEEDLKSISVFQALGANKREITSSYLVFNVIILSIALILGVILSNILAIPFINFMYNIFGIGFTADFQFEYTNAIWIGLILFIVSLISTLLVVKKTFKMDVQQSLKYETKFLEKKNIFEKLYTKTNKDPHPYTKYNIRRIFGRKLHLASLLIALSFSGSFLIFFFGIDDSMTYSFNRKFQEVEQWDCVANTWEYEDITNMTDIMDSLDRVDDYEFAIFDVGLFSKKNSDFDDYLRLIAYEENSKMHKLEVEEGEKLNDDDEALVTRDLLMEFGFQVGDNIYVKSPTQDTSKKVKIVGVVDDIASLSLYVKIETAQDIMNKTEKINTIFLTANGDIEKCAKQVQDADEIEQIFTLESIQDEIEYILDFTAAAMLGFGIILMAFGIVLIGVVFKSIADYRMEDYTNMKAVGLYDKEIRKSLSLELLFYFGVSLFLGIVLGNLFLLQMFTEWETEMPGLVFYIYPISYLYYTILFTMILVFSYYINYRRIKRIDIAEMMRAKTFG